MVMVFARVFKQALSADGTTHTWIGCFGNDWPDSDGADGAAIDVDGVRVTAGDDNTAQILATTALYVDTTADGSEIDPGTGTRNVTIDSASGGAASGFYRSGRFKRGEISPHLLGWMQGFRYERTGILSDRLSPVSCTIHQAGDCGALGLTYAIVLEHIGHDAILLVWSEYEHAHAGFNVDGPSARFELDGARYLEAEMTQEVDLGQHPARTADPNGWIGGQVGV